METPILDKVSLNSPVMFAAWPGPGNVGCMAADFMIKYMQAKEIGRLKTESYFYPLDMTITDNVITNIRFPRNTFYAATYEGKDFVIFFSDRQCHIDKFISSEHSKAYEIAQDVIKAAEMTGCKRIFTADVFFTMNHHSMQSELLWNTNTPNFFSEIDEKLSGKFSQSKHLAAMEDGIFVSGMNGLLPAVAKDKDVEAGIILGEMPAYIQPLNLPYPKAAASVLEAFAAIHGISLPTDKLQNMIEVISHKIDETLNSIELSIPSKLRKNIFKKIDTLEKEDKLTYQDVKNAVNEIEQFFKKENRGDEI